MKRKAVLGIMLTLLFMGVLSLTFDIQQVEASGTIYINADGSVVPDTAPISSVDNVTYLFTDNINDQLTIEKNDIVVDGAGYTVRDIALKYRSNVTIKNMKIETLSTGIRLDWSSNITITGNSITNAEYGMRVYSSSNNTINGNNITNNGDGIILFYPSNNNIISGNNITNNADGIWLSSSNYNTISGNNIRKNGEGIRLASSSNNSIYHNNFIDNTYQVVIYTSGYANFWDDGYPSGGNYWSNYDRVDSDYDGIGNTPHVIDANNTDNYPLMGMFSDFPVTHQEETYHVSTICGSMISDFQFNDVAKTISFNVTGPDYTLGFCRVTVPNIIVQDLWQGNCKVLVDREEPIIMNNWTEGTHTYIYFLYLHSEHKVEIVPEFPSFLILPLSMMATLLAVTVYRRKL